MLNKTSKNKKAEISTPVGAETSENNKAAASVLSGGGAQRGEISLSSELGIFENKEPLFIESVIIHRKEMKLVRAFETSFGRFVAFTRFFPEISFRTELGEIVKGVGECSPLPLPFYDQQCARSTEIGLKYLTAALTGKSYEEANGVAASGLEPVTTVHSFIAKYDKYMGYSISRCAMEAAYWEAVARLYGVPVHKLWGGARNSVPAGTSIGLEPTVDDLMAKVKIAVEEMGVARVKIKIKPGKDIQFLEAIRKKYPDIPLQVDANAAYNINNPSDVARLKELDRYNLLLIEQPGRNDDFIDHAVQLSGLNTPICLDESIHNLQNTRQAIELWKQYSSVEKLIINIKPQRVGGYLESIKIAVLANQNRVKCWCGGMLETALGKTANVHFSARKEVNLPGDHVAQGEYFVEDVAVSPEYKSGTIKVPEGAGWGINTSF
ncbi:MAG: o-succinylbenzoate synthase [Ignavibacteriales bacterium]|nr:MAG: o-succinylbenzoate synthase [Ignavibacteriaceae bacterium]MBW7874202.1 o-succinylbenzoate synthase [Ignavibacteria bacterium]MCZ2142326.1 o-succinylbenzoate synthase [Ignavibacteriales bacterium]OQY75664.1 MAG: o-succinylbenzoate synthase [Ignavibacteriales bacterium UTCHB3]MBV6445211.1 o-succinylbenzoate synthase [Ignavibacteriaceae bacterium]